MPAALLAASVTRAGNRSPANPSWRPTRPDRFAAKLVPSSALTASASAAASSGDSASGRPLSGVARSAGPPAGEGDGTAEGSGCVASAMRRGLRFGGGAGRRAVDRRRTRRRGGSPPRAAAGAACGPPGDAAACGPAPETPAVARERSMERVRVLLAAAVLAAPALPARAAESVMVQCGREYQSARSNGHAERRGLDQLPHRLRGAPEGRAGRNARALAAAGRGGSPGSARRDDDRDAGLAAGCDAERRQDGDARPSEAMRRRMDRRQSHAGGPDAGPDLAEILEPVQTPASRRPGADRVRPHRRRPPPRCRRRPAPSRCTRASGGRAG